jgi:hypothetical protein
VTVGVVGAPALSAEPATGFALWVTVSGEAEGVGSAF